MHTDRRGFVKSAIGASGFIAAGAFREAFAKGVEADEAGKCWRGWKPGEFQVHFICTGVAESMFVIFPDSTSMLLDCGDHAAITRLNLAVPIMPNPSRLAGDWIARYVQRVNPNGNQVDYMMASHFHQDHIGSVVWQSRRVIPRKDITGCYRSGFGLALESLHFRKAIDRGWPDYNDPAPYVEDEHCLLEHMKRIYAYLGKRDGLTVEKFRLGANDQIVPLHDPQSAKGFSVRNIAANGKIALPDGTIEDTLCRNGKKADRYNENLLSLANVFTYGKFKFYTAGDFSGAASFVNGEVWRPEKEIGRAAGKVDVAKINHHGHRCMEPETVRDLAARVYVACVWDQLHVTDDTMSRICDRSLYPEDRIVCPTIMSKERRKEHGDRFWMKDVPEAVYDGAHIVLTVPPGGENYSLSFIDAADESMTVRSVMKFKSHG